MVDVVQFALCLVHWWELALSNALPVSPLPVAPCRYRQSAPYRRLTLLRSSFVDIVSQHHIVDWHYCDWVLVGNWLDRFALNWSGNNTISSYFTSQAISITQQTLLNKILNTYSVSAINSQHIICEFNPLNKLNIQNQITINWAVYSVRFIDLFTLWICHVSELGIGGMCTLRRWNSFTDNATETPV